jgi:hypothetical protein
MIDSPEMQGRPQWLPEAPSRFAEFWMNFFRLLGLIFLS